MKLIYLTIAILIIQLVTDSHFLISQDRPPYEIDTPEPCNYYSSGDFCPYTAWGSQDQYQKVVIGGCTFWVVYRDRTCSSGQSGTIYETNITGIIYSGTGCDTLSNAIVMQKFREERYAQVFLQHPDWYPWCNGTLNDTLTTMYSYSTAQCNQLDNNGHILLDDSFEPVPCDSHQYCCRRSLWFSKEYGQLKIDTLNPQYIQFKEIGWKEGSNRDTCQLPCKSDCYQPLRTKNISPCLIDTCSSYEFGVWQVKKAVIDLPFCTECKITIDFKVRTINNCPALSGETINDMIIDNMELNCPFRIDSIPRALDSACLASVPKDSIYNYAMDYLIKNQFLIYPPIGPPKRYYRIFKSSCWADFFTEGWEGWPSRRVFNECVPESCCWMQIELTTLPDNSHIYNILYTVPDTINCLAPYGCFFYCGPNQGN